MEPLAASPKPLLSFDDDLGNYMLLVEPSSLPTTNFLPTTNTLSLFDAIGRNRNLPVLYDIPKDVDILTDDGDDGLGKELARSMDVACDRGGGQSDGGGGPTNGAGDQIDGGGAHNNGAAEAILKEGIRMKRKKRPLEHVIDLGSDSSDADCLIVFSIPGTSVT